MSAGQPGALDLSFDPGTGVDSQVYSVVLQNDGKILIGGTFFSYDGFPRTNIARLNTNGSLDTGFNAGASIGGSSPYVNAVALQSSGKVLVGGSFTSFGAGQHQNLARLNTNGTLDTSFTADADDTVSTIIVQTNGNVVIGGFFSHVNQSTPRTAIARLSAEGVVDSSFHPQLAGNPLTTVFALARQNDGKILIGGLFTSVNGTPTTNIARLNADGSLDSSFATRSVGGGDLLSAVYAVAVDAQGRVLIGGDFSSVNGLPRKNLARFNSDGTLDAGFNPAAATDFLVNTIAPQSDGRVLLGGFFNQVNDANRNYIAQLNADGTLDAGFDPGSGADAVVYSIALQAQEAVLIGGGFTAINDIPRNGIARLYGGSAPQLVNPLLVGTTFSVSVSTLPGKNYFLEFKDTLGSNSWTPLPAVIGNGATMTLTNTSTAGPIRFYRVRVQ